VLPAECDLRSRAHWESVGDVVEAMTGRRVTAGVFQRSTASEALLRWIEAELGTNSHFFN